MEADTLELWSQGVTKDSSNVKSLYKVTISRVPFTLKSQPLFIVMCVTLGLALVLLISSVVYRAKQEKLLVAKSKQSVRSEVQKVENLMQEEETIR